MSEDDSIWLLMNNLSGAVIGFLTLLIPILLLL